MDQRVLSTSPATQVTNEHGPFRTKRRKMLAGVLAAATVVGVTGAVIAMRTGAAPEPEPHSDVPHHDGDAIVVSARFAKLAGLQTAPAVSAPLVPSMHAVGTVQFDPTHVAALGTRASGVVTKVLQVEGDIVEQGALLAEIESTDVAKSRADLHVAVSKRRAAKLSLARVESLFERQLTTAREFEQARSNLEQQNALVAAAEQQIQALGGGARDANSGVSQLRAPVAGVIAERAIAPGQSLGPGHVAFRIGDMDQLWVQLRIFEREVGSVRVGDVTEVQALSETAPTIFGTVAHVSDTLDPVTRTVDVRVVVPNQERTLRPGQSVKATIRMSGSTRTTISVPGSAVTYVDGAPTVFVAESPTRFAPRKVALGMDSGERLEVTKGLREGELVVSKNVLAIKSEVFR